MTNDVLALARERLGFDELRPGQREAVEALAAGRDALVVMPTGSGKSAIYQLAGLLLEGPTIVVSPLIALQRDQLEAIEDSDLADGAALNSSLRAAERRAAFEGLDDGELEYLLLAPEQFANAETLERLRDTRPSLFVVDEAHCISEWGHDFRPEYLRLGAVAEELGRPAILALTATASPLVRREIEERLELRDPLVVTRGFDRPNIWLGVETFFDEKRKREALLEAVVEAEKPGIVYAATRRHAEDVAAALAERGERAVAYHAGLAAKERDEVQQRFMDDEVEVIVATVAFGMGIDKPNVRFVFHLDVSDSVDSYYQELGRAGRDGDPARALLFYRPEDLGLRRFFAGAGKVGEDEIERVAGAVEDAAGSVEPGELREETGLSEAKVMAAVGRLEDAGVVDVEATGEIASGEAAADLRDVAEEAARAQERHREFERSRIDMIRGYAELTGCRREYLLNYFGEEYDAPCGNCDNCQAGTQPAEVREQPFALGARVRHGTWGEGAVQRYEADKIVVLFDDVGYKTLGVALVGERGLLEPA